MSRSTPFHKQTDPNKQAGQHVYSFDREPYLKHSNVAPDVTLSDYIARKQETPLRITFDEFLLSCVKREDGTYPYGFDPKRPRDFMCLGTLPNLLEIVWNTALKQGKL